MARIWIGCLLILSLLTPVTVVAGVKRAAKPKTAAKVPRSKPPVYKAPKRGGNKHWRPKETKPETKFQRSKATEREFQRAQPCPATGKTTGRCPGYVMNHKLPLARGGRDVPENMQWQTQEEAKAKEQCERNFRRK